MYCNRCGSPLADNARFCPVCGNPIGAAGQQAVPGGQPATAQQQAVPGAQPQAGFMPQPAGSPQQDGTPAAGGSFSAPAFQQTPSTSQPAPAFQPTAGAPQAAVPQPGPVASKRARSKKPLTIALVALVVALGVGGGALFYFTQLAPTRIDEKTLPDAGLRALVSSKFDTNRDGKLSNDEVKLATKIDLSGVASTQGLGKALPDLAVIEGGDKKLDYLDLSGCNKLQKVSLDAASNVRSVNLDGCDGITELALGNADDLKQVDLTGKKKLATLSLSQNTDVKGIGDTQLDELWLPVSYESTDKSDMYGATASIERDENGYVTSYAQSVKQGGGTTFDVEHDKSGLISEMSQRYAGDYDTVYTFTRDKDGKITSIDDDEAVGDFSTTYAYTYDKDGNLTVIDKPGSYGDQSSNFTYQSGHMTTDTEISPGNPRKIIYSYSYDKKGNVTSYTEDFQGDTVGTTWTLTMNYEYGKDGKIKRVSPTSYDTHGNDYGSLSDYAAVDYTYDQQGRISKIESEHGGAYAEFDYDDRGNLYEIDEYDGDDEIQYTYELDYQRYFCNKSVKNKPEEWIRLDSAFDVDRGSWGTGSNYGVSRFASAYVLSPLNAIPEPFVGTRATLK